MSAKNALLAALLVFASSCILVANASAGTYLGIDGSSVNLSHSGDDDINPRGLRLRLGATVARNVDIEAHLGGGSDRTTLNFDRISTSYMGFYLKGYLPIGYRSALFALAGGSNLQLTQSTGGGKFSDDRSGFSYGFGLETQLTRRLDLSADYMRYALDDNEAFSEVSAFNLGLKLYF